ncbi:XrtA-associated tyrosine autokinase [Aquincola sp. MAHUQ-54]|uniref:XrtA-associated tyrosine autokinase n=1 Tax=Aquincola agrisoli TaxID=3119538 RepID=A0AAW9QM50_9BURK
MSLIEQAANRLQALARTGVKLPWTPLGAESAAPLRPGVAARIAASPVVQKAPPRQGHQVQIDLARLQRAGQLVPSLDGSRMADEFRHLKRSVLRLAADRDGPGQRRNALVMVTSSVPAEGKTFCAINLAMSIAMEIDTSVLLVDADVLRPGLPDRLGMPSTKGLFDALLDPGLDLSDLILCTNIPKLSVLPTGTLGTRSAELLASTAMNRLLEELACRYDDRIVIFDGPPLLATPGAQTLAGRVGQVVMVVEAGRTPRRLVGQAFAMLEQCPNVVSILNRFDTAREPLLDGYYGHPREKRLP